MKKRVVTFSWMMKRLMWLHRNNRAEYDAAVTSGSHKFIRGVRVTAPSIPAGRDYFDLSTLSGTQWRLHGNTVAGKHYTFYDPRFTPSTYRKSVTERYIPITLPEGVRSRRSPKGELTEATYHHADGSLAVDGYWQGRRRGFPGLPSHTLTIRDDTGEFVEEPTASMFCQYGPSLLDFGFFDRASPSRKSWLDSISSIPGNLVDRERMLLAAARCYRVAKRLADSGTMRFAMMPAEQYGKLPTERFYGPESRVVTLDRTPSFDPVDYFLPEIFLYWTQEPSTYDARGYAFIRMAIPPLGNSGLLPQPGLAGVMARTFNEKSHLDLYCLGQQHLTRSIHQCKAFDAYPPPDYCDPTPREESEVHDWTRSSRVLVDAGHCNHYTTIVTPIREDATMALEPEEVYNRLQEQVLLDSLPLC